MKETSSGYLEESLLARGSSVGGLSPHAVEAPKMVFNVEEADEVKVNMVFGARSLDG